MKHTMCDLETWGTTPGSAIRSIGACGFRPVSTVDFKDERIIGETFYVNVSWESCKEHGLTQDPNTVAWWARQSKEARDALEENQQTLKDALFQFNAWWQKQGAVYFWSNGANFDGPLLEACYRAAGIPVPWQFYDARDTRTLWDMGQVNTKMWKREGEHHNALADAIHQARVCAMAAGKLWPPTPEQIADAQDRAREAAEAVTRSLGSPT